MVAAFLIDVLVSGRDCVVLYAPGLRSVIPAQSYLPCVLSFGVLVAVLFISAAREARTHVWTCSAKRGMRDQGIPVMR